MLATRMTISRRSNSMSWSVTLTEDSLSGGTFAVLDGWLEKRWSRQSIAHRESLASRHVVPPKTSVGPRALQVDYWTTPELSGSRRPENCIHPVAVVTSNAVGCGGEVVDTLARGAVHNDTEPEGPGGQYWPARSTADSLQPSGIVNASLGGPETPLGDLGDLQQG
jgi:hypothetical protein